MNAKGIFLQALEKQSVEDRQQYLNDACGEDTKLRRRVEALLAAHDDPESYLDRPAARFDVTATQAGSSSGSGLSDSSSHHGRFLPGTKLADRYRIVSLLGSGGMGEVYRADDLRLGQTVALKFIPQDLANDPKRLEYFHNEVRLARQISHPNVCRVYDIGEVDGQLFISMEYIDGEDLKALLHRIGRLQHDKGVEIAQQLCAGLGAAHARGVLHRDLKPANIMLDGQGRVRITDFGLATAGASGGNILGMSGTPAYMAPEQLLGGETSVQSDIYSLGLILFEVFTGTSPRQTSSLAELRRMHEESSSPSDPSDVVGDIDPAVGEAIRRCLQPDPIDRPRSASELANRLPGGDPLAVALAAGETPSPELIAASGGIGAISGQAALTYLGVILALIGVLFAVVPKTSHIQAIGAGEWSPDVLRHRAREILKHLGVETHDHNVYGFRASSRELQQINQEAAESDQVTKASVIAKGPLYGLDFWYRESPQHIFVNEQWSGVDHSWNRASRQSPPWTVPGMTGVELTPFGQLRWFRAIPPPGIESGSKLVAANWDKWFPESLTGINLKNLEAVSWQGRPPEVFDQYQAWEGQWPGTKTPLRVQAASFRGQPVFFAVLPPFGVDGGNESYTVALFTLWFLVVVDCAAALLAFYHYRGGRGDRRGANRLAIYVASIAFVTNLLLATHSPMPFEWGVISSAVARSGYIAIVAWIRYMAIEPLARKYWPEMLISWTRLLRGEYRDPRIGRDVLAGLTIGLVGAIVFRVTDWHSQTVIVDPDAVLSSISGTLGFIGQQLLVSSVHMGFATIVVLVTFALILRSQIYAAIGAWILMLIFFALEDHSQPLVLGVHALMSAALFWFFVKRGLLATVTALFTANIITGVITPDLDAFYASHGLVIVGVIVGLAVFGWHTSQRGGARYSLTRQAPSVS